MRFAKLFGTETLMLLKNPGKLFLADLSVEFAVRSEFARAPLEVTDPPLIEAFELRPPSL